MQYYELIRILVFITGLTVTARISITLTRLVKNYALSHGIVDVPNFRSSHLTPTPRIGGVALALSFYIGLGFYALLEWKLKSLDGMISFPDPYILVGASVMGAFGLYDDLRGASIFSKFGAQFLAATIAVWGGFRFELPVLEGWQGHWVWSAFFIPVTYFWIIGVINAVNFLDGLDGLAAGVSSIVMISLAAAMAVNGMGADLAIAAALIGALVGFLVYNFHPATIFMGDCGSLFLGYILATFSLPVISREGTVVAILIPIMALGLPLLDVTTVFVRRLAQGKNPFSADRDHLHHRVDEWRRRQGHDYRKTVYVLYTLSGLFGLLSFTTAFLNLPGAAMALSIGAVCVVFVLTRFKYLRLPWIRSFTRVDRSAEQDWKSDHGVSDPR